MDGLVTLPQAECIERSHTKRFHLRGLRVHLSPDSCRLGSNGTHKIGWCNGGCTDMNCILGARVHRMKDPGICSTKRGFFWSSDRGHPRT